MKLDVRLELLQFCSVVLNFIFLVLAVSMAGFGAWILLDQTNFLHLVSIEELRLVAVGLMLMGAVVLVVNVIGLVGASRRSRFLLLVYLAFVIVLVLLQLYVSVLLLFSRGKIKESLDEAMDQIILHYGNGSRGNDKLMDDLQRRGRCCGMAGPADWLRNSYIRTLNLTGPDVLPCSCFQGPPAGPPGPASPWCSDRINGTEDIGPGRGVHRDGCEQKKLSDWLLENERTFISMDISLLLIQVLQFTVMASLYRAVGQKAGAVDGDGGHAPGDGGHAPGDGEQNYAYAGPDGNYLDPPADQNHYRQLH